MKPNFETVVCGKGEMILRDIDTDDRYFIKIVGIHSSNQTKTGETK